MYLNFRFKPRQTIRLEGPNQVQSKLGVLAQSLAQNVQNDTLLHSIMSSEFYFNVSKCYHKIKYIINNAMQKFYALIIVWLITINSYWIKIS